MRRKRLGDELVRRKRISYEELEKAIAEQGKKPELLGELLLDRGLVRKEDLVKALEEVTRFSYVDGRNAKVDRAALELIPRSVAVHHCVLPVAVEGNKLIAAMAEPQNLLALDELRFMTNLEIIPRLGFRREINAAIEQLYGDSNTPAEALAKKVSSLEQVDVSNLQFFAVTQSEKRKEAIQEFEAELRGEATPAVRAVSAIIAVAAKKRASDIHIEPQAAETNVRIRVDGVLRELTRIPNDLQNSLISRVKILSDMNIAERRVPQDGRCLVQIGARRLDLRVSTLPTQHGEKIVMRLLDPQNASVTFTELGLSEENSKMLNTVLHSPQGMLLVTGPTGSGKTTTLYSALNALVSPTVNIVTIEDPIEYKVEGLNQVQVNPKAGLTFASSLRSMLRQDPNIIMVGEIRDAETAEIALQAAQTGHLVLSTLHTNDSIAAVTRLLDLGIPPFLVNSSVTAIVAQRLVRKLCACRNEAAMTPECAALFLGAGVADFSERMYIPVGCALCDNSGYKGRMGIYELLLFNDEIRGAVRSGMRDEETRNLARGNGMRLMQEDALEKVKKGLTTLEEVMRVVNLEKSGGQRCPKCNRVGGTSFVFCPYCGAAARPLDKAGGSARAVEPIAKGGRPS